MQSRTIFFGLLVLSNFLLQTIGMAREPLTILLGSRPPTRNQVLAAIQACKRALNSPDNPTTYKQSVEHTREFLASQMGHHRFDAEIHCGGRKAFSENAMADSNRICAENSDNMCFRGSEIEASRLLSFAIAEGFLNWDENYMQNARAVGKVVKVDFIDGPNDLKTEITLRKCLR